MLEGKMDESKLMDFMGKLVADMGGAAMMATRARRRGTRFVPGRWPTASPSR